MFFPDPDQALREMRRVCRPDGTVGVQVYASLDAQPAYGPWVELVARHAGPEATRLLSTYWVHGDLDELRRRFDTAGLVVENVHTRLGTVRWASADEMVQVEIEGSPLVDRISDAQYAAIRDESRELLGEYRTDAGLAAPIGAHLVIARQRRP